MPLEYAQNIRALVDVVGADQTVGFYYAVVDALLKTGFSEDEIGKIGGGNFCRVFDAATKGHQYFVTWTSGPPNNSFSCFDPAD